MTKPFTCFLAFVLFAHCSVAQKTKSPYIPFVRDGKYGFFDRQGNVVIKPQLDVALPFFEGLALAQSEELWGYIDTAGRFVIEPRFSEADNFSGGLARIKLSKAFGGPSWGVHQQTR
ncbi:MAG: WG repeat-containing protein [Bacteroidota bacterium]